MLVKSKSSFLQKQKEISGLQVKDMADLKGDGPLDTASNHVSYSDFSMEKASNSSAV